MLQKEYEEKQHCPLRQMRRFLVKEELKQLLSQTIAHLLASRLL